jgi:mannose-1-phosphate guanylyltransferase/mannose-6-phosphate isomerase
MNDDVQPVILCGGAGTRLWPVSRRSYPKQFSPLLGGRSLFQDCALRLSGPGFLPPLVLTAEPFRFIAAEQLAAIEIGAAALLIEPCPRNTAPAILAAALWLAAHRPSVVMLVAPSDHVIPDSTAFRAAVFGALPAAASGAIVTFGITPDRPETGYGWLEPEDCGAGPIRGPLPLARFVEKPDADTAARMFAAGRHLWNAGIFLARAEVFVAAFRAHAGAILSDVEAALEGARQDLGFLRLCSDPWARLPDVSVDYAIMEKAPGLQVMPYAGHWSDLGGWQAVWQEGAADAAGVVQSGQTLALDCTDTLLRADAAGQVLVGIGLSDIVAVAMPDAVLVARKSQTQRLRVVVETLRARGLAQAEQFPRDHRPWGWFDRLIAGHRFQVKRIVVQPGGALSLQSHTHRAEHWVVVEGTARVTLDGQSRLVTENESVFIPLGTRHRLENPGKLQLTLIEVQTGAYLGEDDIERHSDIYDRPADDAP